jgi:MFS family permease
MPAERLEERVGGRYANYVLAVLVLVYVFNFIDRQILSILAEEIKADLGLSDAEIGFLYGTAFAVFYAVFGIPLGRLADVWTRRSLIAVGLAFWSAMTALSGTARGFPSLAAFRIGVGVGEASASPAAYSMLSDYFPVERRGTALAVYSSGVYIGAGIGIFLGGWIVDGWRAAYPDGNAPFGLVPWQAAFFAVGLPGLAMALWVRSLGEPRRGMSEGLPVAPHPAPFREFARELQAVLPPLTLVSLARAGAGARGLAANLIAAAAIALVAWALVAWLGSPAQWIALGIGVYSAVSWAQGLRLRDPPTFAMIFRSRALVASVVGFSSIGFVGYGIGFWAAPYFLRVHGVSASEVGTYLGLPSALGGWLGVTLGGVLSDRLRPRTANARLWMGAATAALTVPVAIALLTTESVVVAYLLNFAFSVVSALWVGNAPATVNDFVLPRMRAIASAFYILTVTFLGLALGPYCMGTLSDSLTRSGMASGDALRTAMLAGLGVFAFTVACLAYAGRHVAAEEASRLDRARAAGERV